MLNTIFHTFFYSNDELFCKQSVLLIKGATQDILNVYLESDGEDSHIEICSLVKMDRLIPRGNKR